MQFWTIKVLPVFKLQCSQLMQIQSVSIIGYEKWPEYKKNITIFSSGIQPNHRLRFVTFVDFVQVLTLENLRLQSMLSMHRRRILI